jgi:HD-like signal output (HDOD) protein
MVKFSWSIFPQNVVIRFTIAKEKIFPMNVLQRLFEITGLPALPEIMVKIQRIVNSEEGNATLLSKIIEQDLSLTAKVLKIANSAFFSTGNKRISSLPLAIARIGFNEIRSITMAITLIKQLSKKSSFFDYRAFWRHSLSAAYLTQTIASELPKKLSNEELQFCFLSGLLHDMGILIYDQFFHPEFERIMEYAVKEEKSFLVAEQTIAGKETHQMVGSALLEIWKIDTPVISGVRFHHAFDKAPGNHLIYVAIIYLAEYILCNGAVGSFEGTIREINASVWDYLKIPPDTLGNMFAKAEAEVEKADIILAMEIGEKNSSLRPV